MTIDEALTYAREHAQEIAAAVNRGDQDAKYIAAAHLALTTEPDDQRMQSVLIMSVRSYKERAGVPA